MKLYYKKFYTNRFENSDGQIYFIFIKNKTLKTDRTVKNLISPMSIMERES